MKHPPHLRRRSVFSKTGTLASALLCVLSCVACTRASAQGKPPQKDAAERLKPAGQTRAAEDAYLAGARRLEHGDLSGAQVYFTRALKLDPDNPNYAAAVVLTREHTLTQLVQRAGKARQSGDTAGAENLLAEARVLDPASPLVLEHSQASVSSRSAGNAGPSASAAGSQAMAPLADRARLLSPADTSQSWKIAPPVLAGATHLHPADELKSFHLHTDVQDTLQQVTSAYGIRAVFDESVERKSLRFDLDDKPYEATMAILLRMAHLFAVPLDETSVIVSADNLTNRARLERLMQETIFLPNKTLEEINDLANVVRTIFEVKQATVEPGLGTIVLRATEDTLGPMNRTLSDLIDGTGEVMLEVKFYEVNTTHMRNVGATIPSQAGIYNVDAAATALVNANQTLVQEGIAQGLIKATDSNILIAGALIASGLVKSSLLASTIGGFGGGITTTGITESGGLSFNLALNSTDTRALDDVQMRVDDRKPAVFRAGTRYPVITSTYTTGLSTAASALSGATINGVSVASLLSQYAGGSSATIPQVAYEDLGVTLTATPAIQKSGRINLLLDMKIEALAGGSANGIPVLGSRALTSDITVGDGESILLVSSTTRNESAAVSGLPGLSELPGFQAPIDQNAEKDAGQLVIMVTPHVVRRRSNVVAGPRLSVRAQEPGLPLN